MFKMEDNYFDEALINGTKRDSVVKKAIIGFLNLFNPVEIWKKTKPTEAEKLFFTKGELPSMTKKRKEQEANALEYEVREVSPSDVEYAAIVAQLTIGAAKEKSKASLG